MSLTYLQLCQRAAIECDISGPGPVTVAGNSGELNRICAWVATALNDIEIAHPDWGWMLKDMSFVTIAGQAEYTTLQCGITAGTFGEWERTRFRNYPTAVGNIGEIPMKWITYDGWRDNYSFGATRYVQTRPIDVTVHPNAETLCLGPYPSADYTITGQYFRAPQILTLNGDVPDVPTPFQLALVYKAMMYYGAYESAPEVYNRGEAEFNKMMARMDAQRLPDVGFA